ncbi:DUF294 nucleotidyltransferase-like domain-containing protein [Idiomarina xiamenensis]|uniref:Signal protein n=1 Tax=Idiomarina xiamenensis 10-D-4 TaxID=740709 RepID=K2KWR5_9GAMM|nr:DUF294 nucleotidyltransferase-like domain-containing protein [Idiomarina xiamenensis]EKE82095.1 signal protein [Idiomarina xiamenensis 10-D-4]
MTPEFSDVDSFFADCPPFDELNEQHRRWAVRQIQAVYMNADNCNELLKQLHPALFVVRSGIFDLRDQQQRLLERLEAGDLFGFPSLLTGRAIINHLECIQDGIVYALSQTTFDELRSHSKAFEQYFIRAHGQRLLTERQQQGDGDWSDRTVASVLQHEAISLTSTTPIQEAAKLMSVEGVSSVLVVDKGQLVGILTDRDIRNRVVAAGLPYEVAVSAVMTQAPEAVYARRSLLDALTLMTQHNVHHLPVLADDDTPLGMVTTTDLMRQQRSEPVFLISALYKAQTREQLVTEAQQIPAYLQTFAGRVKDTSVLGRLMASLTDAMTRQLITLYEREHGVAPAAYAWLAFGSQGREDQTLSSDQDNGLLLADGLTDGQRAWFAQLGEYVCEGLHACGIPLCPGNIMASNADCRGTLSEWLQRFDGWSDSPTPKALMYCQIFFDSRMVVGNKRLYAQYREGVAKIGKREVFLANLALLVNRIAVPLGLFNRLRTQSDKGADTIDIKRYGIALINDIVRLYALQEGLLDAATPRRLAQLKGRSVLSDSDNQSLQEAWQFLTQLRLNHQLRVFGSDKPQNALDPDQLSTLSRRQLKSAFRIIKEAQQAAGLKFGRQGY